MNIRDRIKELKRVKASELRQNPKNWRKHPEAQHSAMRGLLEEVGYVDALLVRELPGGAYEIVDGHLRAETTPDMLVPILVLDITEEEADIVLATFNPVAEMAETDPAKLDELLQRVNAETEAVRKLLEDLALENGLAEGEGKSELKPVAPKPPPKFAWVLIGIPLVRYGEIAAVVEGVANHESVEFVETTVNDGPKNGQRKRGRKA